MFVIDTCEVYMYILYIHLDDNYLVNDFINLRKINSYVCLVKIQIFFYRSNKNNFWPYCGMQTVVWELLSQINNPAA